MKRYRKSTLMIFNIPSIPESPSLPVREAFLFHFNCHVGIHVIHFAFREALFTIFCSCCNSMEKKKVINVFIHVWAPRAEDGVYPSWTKCRSLVHGWWKIDKSKEERNVFRTLFQLFSALFILPLCCRNRQDS
jgi:hypothetical protein